MEVKKRTDGYPLVRARAGADVHPAEFLHGHVELYLPQRVKDWGILRWG